MIVLFVLTVMLVMASSMYAVTVKQTLADKKILGKAWFTIALFPILVIALYVYLGDAPHLVQRHQLDRLYAQVLMEQKDDRLTYVGQKKAQAMLALYPHHEGIIMLLAKDAMLSKEYDTAINYFKKLIDLHQNDAESVAHLNKAIAFARAKRDSQH